MKLAVMSRLTLLFDVFPDRFFTRVLSNRSNVVSIRPELTTPQLLLDLGNTSENLTGGNAFDDPYNFGRTIGWNRLDEKMHMVLIGSKLQKNNLIPFGNLQTDGFEFFIDFGVKHHTPVFRRAHNMLDQDRDIMTFTNQSAHRPILAASRPHDKFAPQAAGNVPPYDSRKPQRGYWGENGEWKYFLHGGGCRLTHRQTGERIEWDAGDLNTFNVDWFVAYLQRLLFQPSDAEDIRTVRLALQDVEATN